MPCLFILYAEYITQNARLDDLQAGLKIVGRNTNNLRYAGDTTLVAESKEELKSLLMKEESEKADLKLNIKKIKIMASSHIISWQIGGEKMEVVTDFLSFWALKSLLIVTGAMKLEDSCFLEEKL